MAQTIGSLDLNAFSDLYSDSTQYFWFESNASATYGAGAHVTLVPDTSFISNPTGQNILMNTDGFSIRNGLLPMMTLDNNSLDFNVVDTTAGTYVTTATFTSTGAQIGQSGSTHLELNTGGLSILNGTLPMMTLDNDSLDFNVVNTTAGTYTTTATFGSTGATIGQTNGSHIQISSSGLDVNTDSSTNIASFGLNGARIGQSGAAHSVIDADGQRFYAKDGSTMLANIGYFTDTAVTLDPYPYYTFGTRESLSGVGRLSFAEGERTTSSGTASHAEGQMSVASDVCCHAEGWDTEASGEASHAEGYQTTASGENGSHAEGNYTFAIGESSHSQGLGTTANKLAQMAIGSWNVLDTSSSTVHPSLNDDYGEYALIIGNGTNKNNRSNALTVDWDGNINAAGSYYGSIPTCKYIAAASTAKSATGWSYMNGFSGLTQQNWANDTDYFGYDVNGIRIKKAGIYLVSVSVHVNGVAGDSYACKLTDYTHSTDMSGPWYVRAYAGWGDISFTDILVINESSAIVVLLQRYSGSGAYRPGNLRYTATYLGPTDKFVRLT